MTKDFTPYDLAYELKQIGFDEYCLGYYNIDPYLPNPTFNLVKPFDHEWCLPAPLYQQAFRWFREKYDLQCWIHDGGYVGKCCIKITGYNHDKFYFSSSEPMEYEEAELACLKKLIELVKQKP